MPPTEQQRTSRQNRAIYKLFTEIAREMQSQGIEQKTVMDNLVGYDAPVTPDFIKQVWKAIQFTMYRTTSTKDLTTKQIDEVFDVLNKFLGEKFAIHIPFPSMESLMLNSLEDTI